MTFNDFPWADNSVVIIKIMLTELSAQGQSLGMFT